MLLTMHPRFRPWNEIALLHHALRSASAASENYVSLKTESSPNGPALNLRVTKDAYLLEAEFPGTCIDDVEVEIHGKAVTLSGTRRVNPFGAQDETSDRVLLREQWFGDFSRTVHLPEDVDPAQVTSEFESGLLRLHLPKKNQPTPLKIRLRDVPPASAA